MKHGLILLVTAVLVLGCIVTPGTAKAVDQGTLELRLYTAPGIEAMSTGGRPGVGVIAGDIKPAAFSLNLKGGVGYFLSQSFEVGGFTGIMLVSAGGTTWALPIGGFIRYVAPITSLMSFWGEGDLGFLVAGAGRGTAFEVDIGGSGGLDFNFNPAVALFVGLGVDVLVGDATFVPIGLTYGIRGYI